MIVLLQAKSNVASVVSPNGWEKENVKRAFSIAMMITSGENVLEKCYLKVNTAMRETIAVAD